MDSCREHKHHSSSSSARKDPKNNTRTGNSFSLDPSSPTKKLNSNYDEFQSNKENEADQIEKPDLTFLFNPLRDEVKPYHLDGDTSMYTESSIVSRANLKSEPMVIESINDFMDLYQSDNKGCIGRKEYERMYHKICSVLRISIDPSEKRKILDDDWKKDSKGQDKMSREMLFDAMFELCDVWCPHIDPIEYKEFFNQIKFRIRYEGYKDSSAYDIIS
mmetsp:Transcript_4051/g.3881  ORF Transcript_4051/g.3881 Transcript_4051/m.3881 type:complete len:218 (+) Transcript_4051:5-658(+)